MSGRDLLARLPNRQHNLDFFSEVIGCLSSLRFGRVTDKFIQELSASGAREAIREAKAEMVIRCMRYLQLKVLSQAFLFIE